MDVWIESLIVNGGVLGVAFLMFVENIFPPVPSEVVLTLAGFAAARGDLALVPLIVAGTLGSLAGTTVWFIAARWLGAERLYAWSDRFGRIMTLTRTDIDRAQALFDRRGHLVILFGRLVPAIRSVISIPAGLAGMGWGRFLLFSTIGSLAWTTVLVLIGNWLGNQAQEITRWVSPVTYAIVAFCIAFYVWRVVTYPRRKQREEERVAGIR